MIGRDAKWATCVFLEPPADHIYAKCHRGAHNGQKTGNKIFEFLNHPRFVQAPPCVETQICNPPAHA
jgi:hypothetical protein